MKQKFIYLISVSLLAMAFVGCNNSDESFDNKIYITSAAKTKNILLQGNDTDQTSFQVAMPSLENRDVTFNVAADPSALGTYNEAYGDNAELLPEGYYSFPNSQITIASGSVLSTEVVVLFKNLTDLDRQKKYVLPVTINNSSIAVLQSARTIYYVVKGAALINVVGDISENNAYVDWVKNEDFTAMRTFTAEALIYPRKLERTLSTIMGIEGKFLIRIGDASIPSNQLQIATSNGNFTSSDLAIPTNAWTHIAVTYDAGANTINVFINGKNMYATTSANVGTVNWGVAHSDESDGKPRCFWIGYSYNNDRYLDGDISECRVWNKVLTAAEINMPNHFYYVEPTTEGLIAYWKFNDGGGNTIKDYSINGNNATASKDMKWNSVELPIEE